MLNHWKIGKRLMSGFGVIAGVLLLAAAGVLFSYRSIHATLDQVTLQSRNSLLIQSAQHSSLETVFYLQAAAGAPAASRTQADSLGLVASHRRDYLADFQELHAQLDAEGLQRLVDVERTMALSRETCLRVGELIHAGKQDEASQLFIRAAIPRIAGWSAAFTRLDQYGRDAMLDSVRAARDLLALNTRILLCGTLLGLGGLGFLAYALTRSIVQPLNSFMGILGTVAQGDLTVQARIDSTDEVGQLGVSLNHALAEIRGSLQGVAHSSASVASGATQLSASAEQMLAATHELAQGGRMLHDATESVAAAMVQFIASETQVAGNVKASAELSREAVAASHTGFQGSQKASADMGKISSASSRIAEILRVIQDIAQQTNLLSVNAAIEAAKAGEHGKGFAVVAAEIHKLADRSHTATQEIERLILETHSAVLDGTASAQNISGLMTHIHTAISTVSKQVHEIGQATTEQSDTAGEIARRMDESTQAVGQNAAATQQLATTVQEITRTAADLARVSEAMAMGVARFQV